MIVPALARMLIREHIYRPIKGRVLTLGRQTIGMNFEETIELLKQEKFFVSESALREVRIKYDSETKAGKGRGFISDEVFFNLLGVKQVSVMDVSDYEGADILHNLNEPIPKSLEGQFDFIIDGGTFDHLFDLRVAFQNVVKMLKISGRIFQWNAASNFTGQAYISFGPDVFYDFYTLNKFADCKVYLAEVDDQGQRELWDMYEFKGESGYKHFYSKRILMAVVLAEKGPDSTYNTIPIQAQYRVESTKVNKVKTKTEVPARISILKRIVLKYKENGARWIFHRILDELFFKKIRRKEIRGYRYIGKI